MVDVIRPGELLIDYAPARFGVGPRQEVAVGLRRFGVGSAFAGKAGNDAFGQFLDTRRAADYLQNP